MSLLKLDSFFQLGEGASEGARRKLDLLEKADLPLWIRLNEVGRSCRPIGMYTHAGMHTQTHTCSHHHQLSIPPQELDYI